MLILDPHFAPIEHPAGLSALVARLTGADLAARVLERPDDVLGVARGLDYVRLSGAGRKGDARLHALPTDAVAGVLDSAGVMAFLVMHDGDAVRIALGLPEGRSFLAEGLGPAIGGPAATPLVVSDGTFQPPFVGALVGIPCPPPMPSAAAPGLLDRLLDSLRGRPFMLLALATLELSESIADLAAALRDRVHDIERNILQMGSQSNVHRRALLSRDLLDRSLQRLERGVAAGMWRTSFLFGASDPTTMRNGLHLLATGWRGSDGHVLATIRAMDCRPDASAGPSAHATLLHPDEVAAFCLLPGRDRAGFQVRHHAQFDVEAPSVGELPLGRVLDGDVPTPRSYRIPLDQLCRHVLVTGQTGSGKSTTIRNLLLNLDRSGIPFLVLEPAKSEYRWLKDHLPRLRVIRGGSFPHDGESFLTLNPFRFPEGIPLHRHLDLLKQVFTVAFGFMPPASYLLETALLRAYQATGWDPVTGTHPLGHDRLAFPTLADLLAQVDAVVSEAGYDRELSRNLRGALRTRVGNLCIGTKGMCLDTRDDTPDADLFGSPTILDLSGFGSDDEKALVMGLATIRLFELRESQADRPTANRLKHLLVVEEAHRLLRRSVERSLEEGNMAHVAVRTFTNLMAEVRAFGQGVAVVEQIPSLLAPEVVKHCHLKIVHRLDPKEDRDLVGDAMVLEPERKDALALLDVGQAVVRTDGRSGAVKVAIPPCPGATDEARLLPPSPGEHPTRPQVMPREAWTRHPRLALAADAALFAAANDLDPNWTARLDTAIQDVTRERRLQPTLQHLADIRNALLRSALERRAVHLGWDSRRLDSVTASGGFSARALASALTRRATAPHRECDRCADTCRFGYEAHRLARDPHVTAEIADLRGSGIRDSQRQLEGIVREGAESVLGWTGGLPRGFTDCVVALCGGAP